jgi:hypothetical protein
MKSEGDKVVLDEVVQLGCGETAKKDPSVIGIGQRAQGKKVQGTGSPGIPGSLDHEQVREGGRVADERSRRDVAEPLTSGSHRN